MQEGKGVWPMMISSKIADFWKILLRISFLFLFFLYNFSKFHQLVHLSFSGARLDTKAGFGISEL